MKCYSWDTAVSILKKISSEITILLTLSKLRGEFRTQSNIKSEAICKNNQWF